MERVLKMNTEDQKFVFDWMINDCRDKIALLTHVKELMQVKEKVVIVNPSDVTYKGMSFEDYIKKNMCEGVEDLEEVRKRSAENLIPRPGKPRVGRLIDDPVPL